MNPTEPNPLADLDEDALFERAGEIQAQLQRRVADNATLRGGKGSKTLDDPTLQEMTAQAALQAALAEAIEPPASKGPALRKAPKVNARKRQRQARRKQRS